MKKFLSIGIGSVILGLIVWLVLFSQYSNRRAVMNNTTIRNLSNSSATLDAIVLAAQTTQLFQYGGFNFAVPVNMVKSFGEGGISWYFSEHIENIPLISFYQSEAAATELVKMEKDSLPSDQRIVREGSMVIHGQQWQYLEVTSNLNINYTYWFSEKQPTVQVIFSQGPSEVMEIFNRVILSATLR